MSQHSDTIRYYDEHADDYIRGTIGLEMQSLHEPFLDLLPAGGRILDAGCGSGRDSQVFINRGYRVTSIDASKKMVAATTQLTGQPALQMRLQDISFADEFDGIWACASLLHVPFVELTLVLQVFARALRSSGICYVSFKDGVGERNQIGLQYTDMDETSITELLAGNPGLTAIKLWRTNDIRIDRCDRWLNVLVQKSHG